ncbi:MAG: RNase adapter RapZ [Clostridiaceae bacterium]|nr:RNase adapter RapZ [Clostridiaceae bacterium]
MKVLIVTGMSGAGSTQATKCLEDLGYFCIDNMPPMLLPKFGELYLMNEMKTDKLALVMDVRSGDFFNDLITFMDDMKKANVDVSILFLDCSDEVLINRYKENRRLHPLAQSGNNLEGIRLERQRLSPLKGQSDHVIDTTNFSVWDLKNKMIELFKDDSSQTDLIVHVVSFGYKNGLPIACDLLFDVRFISNPFYVPELRHYTGNDERVKDYVLGADETKEFLKKLFDLLQFLLPLYQLEGKQALTIGIGCTGGKHRSVAIANELVKQLKVLGYRISLEHRDIGK